MPERPNESDKTKRAITSEGLSTRAIRTCGAVSALLLGCGIIATFVAGTGAAPAAMILFGSLFLVLALMKRVPLSLEVGGAKFDASYEVDKAYDAGRDTGLQQGVELALNDVEKAKERGESGDAALEEVHQMLERWVQGWTKSPLQRWEKELLEESSSPSGTPLDAIGYRGPIACNAAGITYRQLDYWARVGLVEPSVRSTNGSTTLYSIQDVILLRVIKQLLDAGISLRQIRTVMDHVRARGLDDLQGVTLISDGSSVYWATSSEEVVDLMQSGEGMFGIALDGVARDVRRTLRELPAESGPTLFGDGS